MRFLRLSAEHAKAVAEEVGIEPSDAEVLADLDQFERDPAITAIAAGATGPEAVDAVKRGCDIGRYSQDRAYGADHEGAVNRSSLP